MEPPSSKRRRLLIDTAAIEGPGKLTDKYDLGLELGSGQFGVTRLCHDKATGKAFACKTITSSEEIHMDELRTEVDIMRRLPKHRNIVSLVDAFEDGDQVHIVMELCTGGELFDRIVECGHYTERAAADIFRPIVEAVQFCHQHGVLHRDLKPENLLFASKESSVLKLIDFGLSTFFKPGQVFTEKVGSPYYVAPDVLQGKYGPEVDIWSAGITLCILLCGVPPYWAETQQKIEKVILTGSGVDFEREPWNEISSQAKDLINKMLDRDPSKRLTAKQVLHHPWLRRKKVARRTQHGSSLWHPQPRTLTA